MPAYEPIGRTDDLCPTCLAMLVQRPKQKAICSTCGEAIFVRTRPDDDVVVLVNDNGRRGIEAAKWAKNWIAKPFTAEETQTQLSRLANHRDRTLASARDLVARGVQVQLVILTAPHGCPAALRQIDRTYTVDDLPSLPMPGCSVSPKCSCVVSPKVIDDGPEQSDEDVDRAYDEALSRLDPLTAHRLNATVEAAIRGFGIVPTPSRWSSAPGPDPLLDTSQLAAADTAPGAPSRRSWLNKVLRRR